MPVLKPCIERGCRELSSGTRCPRHQAERDHKRNVQSFYQSPEWRRTRKRQRRRLKACAICGSRKRVTMHHKQGRRQGGSDEDENLVALCGSCHSSYEADLRAGRDTELRRLVEAL